MNSLGWSRREPDLPVNTAQQTGGLLSSIKSLNPWGDSGYVRLPTTEGPGAPLPARNRREEEEAWFACESTFHDILFPMFHCACVSHPHGQVRLMLADHGRRQDLHLIHGRSD